MQKLHRHRGADPEDERSFGGGCLADLRLTECRWWLDSPVFNSGRLKGIILGVAAETGWPWQVELVTNPDRVLSGAELIVSSSDHVILDRCQKWFNLTRQVIANQVPHARVLDLGSAVEVEPPTG